MIPQTDPSGNVFDMEECGDYKYAFEKDGFQCEANLVSPLGDHMEREEAQPKRPALRELLRVSFPTTHYDSTAQYDPQVFASRRRCSHESLAESERSFPMTEESSDEEDYDGDDDCAILLAACHEWREEMMQRAARGEGREQAVWSVWTTIRDLHGQFGRSAVLENLTHLSLYTGIPWNQECG